MLKHAARPTFFLAVALAALASAAPTHAQGLAGLLLRFFSPSNPVVLQQAPEPFNHAAHFVSQPNAQDVLRQLNGGIASQVSTFPLGSSSPGFTFTYDAALGIFNRSAESFGPVFSERAITAGKGKFSFGVSTLDASYDRFEGQDLSGGDIQLYLTHQDVDRSGSILSPWFEGDIIRADLALDLQSRTTVVVANYGVSDRLDLGLALPFQQIDLAARIDTQVERLASGPDPFVVHVFSGNSDTAVFREAGSANGLGDVVLRGKYNFMRRSGGALAAGVDLRLPTGDEADLLGTGATQAKLYLIASGPAKRFSPRASVGYTFSSGGSDFTGDLPDEINYTAGFDAALHPRVTLTADLLGRNLRDASRLVETTRTFNFTQRLTPSAVQQTTRVTPEGQTGNLNLLVGAASLKVNPVGRLLVSGGVLFSIGNAGLQDKVTPVIGLDYSF
jgi:hypothetical protein